MPGWLTARPVAHRGLHAGRVLENTMPAFEAAMARDFAVELDIQPSADGEAMVFHDDTLDRLTEAQGPVAGLTAAALQRIRFKATDARIPTLGDVLGAVQGRVPLVIEIKSGRRRDRGLEARAAALLRDYQGPAALMSFDPDSVAAVRALAPEIPRGIVAKRYDDPQSRDIPPLRRVSLRHILHAPRTRPHFVAYSVRGLTTFGPFALRRLGLPLLTWTVRTPEDLATARRHADQIIFEGFDPESFDPQALPDRPQPLA